jgi:hypothetical protein
MLLQGEGQHFMSKRKNIILWFGALCGLPVSGYFLMCAVFYAWLNASEPSRWPPLKAGVWSGGSFLLSVTLFVFFIYSVVNLVKHNNQKYRAVRNAT